GQGYMGVHGVVDGAWVQASLQRLGVHDDQLDPVGAPHDGVGHQLPLGDPGDALADVGQRLEVRDVEGGDHVDAGLEQLVDVLPALGVTAAGNVAVGQLVDEDDLGAAGQDGVDVH